MASFQSKIGWKRLKKIENKSYRSVSFLSATEQKIKKKFEKLRNTLMDSFHAKIGRKRMRKSENKNYRSVPFLPDAKQKIPKQQQKNSKN